MNKFELQKLRDLPIEGVAERLGIQVTRHKSLCPFHDDHHASLSFKVSRNTCRCFVCMTQSIGPIDLVMRYLHVDFKEACKWLADEHNVNLTPSPSPKERRVTNFDASRFERYFERPFLNNEARNFLFEERRLDPRVVRWCRLTSWRDKQGTPWLQIPYYDQQGKLIGIQNRNLKTPSNSPVKGEDSCPDSNLTLPSLQGKATGRRDSGNGDGGGSVPRFRSPLGSQCGIYNLPVLNLLRPGDELFITEGCSDCWAMLSAGHKAVAIPSATLLSRRDKEQLSIINYKFSIMIAMYPDNDVPGERLFLQLREVLPSLVRYQLPPGHKDFSDYYVSTRRKEDCP